MKRKFLILSLIIFIILLLFFITLMKQEKRGSECKIDDDCPQALCGAECGYICKSGSCIFVKCEDHGKLNGFECICNEGWTGYHCERKILNDHISCDKDKPLQDIENNCHSCNTPYKVKTVNKCSEICPNRINQESFCILIECPSTHPLRASDGSCYPCDFNDYLQLENSNDCEKKCPNRILKKDYNPANFLPDELFCAPRNR